MSLSWYHTIDLPDGTATPGEWDLRPIVGRLPIPDVRGLRVLDVGTHDGFYAFELERRGAGEVVALDLADPADLNWPGDALPRETAAAFLAGRDASFRFAHEARASKVRLELRSVYDLDPADVGTFDFAIVGTLLLHLRDPIGALRAIRRVARRLLVNDVVSTSMTLRHPRQAATRLLATPDVPFWSVPNVIGLRRYVTAAGWRIERAGRPYLIPYGKGVTSKPPRSLRDGLIDSLVIQRGAPHAWVLAAA